MLRTEYDQEADALYLTITDEPVARTEEVDPGTLVDLDDEDSVVGIEVINPSRLWPAALVIRQYGLDPSDQEMIEALFPVQAGHEGPIQPRGQGVASDAVGLDLERLSA